MALNPIEKRRQLVVSQLAAANPGRINRNRRLVLEKKVACQTAIAAAVGCAPHPPSPSVSSAQSGLDGSCSSPSRPPPEIPDAGGYGGGLSPQPPARARPSSASRRPANAESQRTAASRSSPMDSLDVGNKVLESLQPSWPPSPARCLASPRRPLLVPTSNAPMPGGTGRGPPCDLLLKDDCPDDDPLEHTRSIGAGFSMAPPSPAGHRPGSAGLSMPPPACGGYGSMRPESAGALESKSMGSSAASLSLGRKMLSTPPNSASTADPMCGTSERFFSTAGSLNSSFFA